MLYSIFTYEETNEVLNKYIERCGEVQGSDEGKHENDKCREEQETVQKKRERKRIGKGSNGKRECVKEGEDRAKCLYIEDTAFEIT